MKLPTRKVCIGTGPEVVFQIGAHGVAITGADLSRLLAYKSSGTCYRDLRRLFRKPGTPAQWYLTVEEVDRFLSESACASSDKRRVHRYFKQAVQETQVAVPIVSVGTIEGSLTPREQLQQHHLRVRQAEFVTAWCDARRAVGKLLPWEGEQLTRLAAELALGGPIMLDLPPPVPAPDATTPSVASGGASSAVPVPEGQSPVAQELPSDAGKAPNLAAVIGGARLRLVAAPAANEPASPILERVDPFDFPGGREAKSSEPTASVTARSVTPPLDTRAWIVSRFSPPHRCTASELAILVGFKCTKQKIGLEAGRLGFKEGHPWVETKQVQGRHSKREDCTVYYYSREAALALIEAVLSHPTQPMRVAMKNEKDVPVHLFKPEVNGTVELEAGAVAKLREG